MKRFLILFLPFIINSQVIQTNDTIVLDEVSVKILRESNKEELSIYSISKIDLDLKQKYLRQYNLSEYLNYVPGVFIMNSNNYAQDERISIRGFGSRANFGVRGIKIYVDGLPETFVDGQSQLDNINLEIINQLEVLRGVNSSLYGNSSGGIISISTIDFFEKDFIKTNLSAGSFESLKINLTSGINLNKGKIIFHLNRSSSNVFRNNSKFLNHVKNQWVRYQNLISMVKKPTRMSKDWKPSEDCFDVLNLAKINKGFAESQIHEFKLYWLETKEMRNCWNSKFIQHVKFKWKAKHGNTKNVLSRLKDHEWAVNFKN